MITKGKLHTLFSLLDQKLEYYLILPLYVYIVLIVIIEIIGRYVFAASSSWGEPSAIIVFIYLCYIGAARVVKRRGHFKIDVLFRYMNEKQLFGVYLFSDICFGVLAFYIIRWSYHQINMAFQWGYTFPGLDINIAFAYFSLPVGWGLIGVRLLQRIYRTIRDYQENKLISEGEREP